MDDIMLGSSNQNMVDKFVEQMQSEFKMSMVREMCYFLGLQVKQKVDSIFISQSTYTRNLIKKFDLEKAAHKRTPAATHVKITKDEAGTSVDQTLYRSMIGSLLYLTVIKPDIAHAAGVCSRYQANPKESHLMNVKRILKYVYGTSDYGLWYTKDTNSCLVGYCDVDWVENSKDRKSTSGGCFFLGKNLVSWFTKKWNNISLSKAEEEYIAAERCCTQMLWMKQKLEEYGVGQDVMTLYCNNMSAINISKNPVQHSKIKRIDIRHHFIQELVEKKVITLKHVSTEKQLADNFTKALDNLQFETLRSSMGLCVVENQVVPVQVDQSQAYF
ncbi:unnamed protein product [Rhodiola kirilowii]